MSNSQRIIRRYSMAFKQKVVSEIESGKLNLSQAQKLYDITGGQTIQNWIHKFGKNHLLNKVVRIEMKDEKDKLKELEQRNRELESALAQAHLKMLRLEFTIEAANEYYQVDLKKSLNMKALTKP